MCERCVDIFDKYKSLIYLFINYLGSGVIMFFI